MSDCCGTKDVMLLACSGGSNVGQITNDAAKALDRLGAGRMSCLVGVGAQLPSFVQGASEARVVAVIDGCSVACGKVAMQKAGLEPDVYVVATELGIEKGHHFDHTADEVEVVCQKARQG